MRLHQLLLTVNLLSAFSNGRFETLPSETSKNRNENKHTLHLPTLQSNQTNGFNNLYGISELSFKEDDIIFSIQPNDIFYNRRVVPISIKNNSSPAFYAKCTKTNSQISANVLAVQLVKGFKISVPTFRYGKPVGFSGFSPYLISETIEGYKSYIDCNGE